MSSGPYAPYFAGWDGPWEYADAATTARRLAGAGFVAVETGLEAAPVTLGSAAEYREYLATVIFRLHLARIPDAALRERFLDELTAQAVADDPPFLLDYWRLNLRARRPIA
jgi:hypothetical protein